MSDHPTWTVRGVASIAADAMIGASIGVAYAMAWVMRGQLGAALAVIATIAFAGVLYGSGAATRTDRRG